MCKNYADFSVTPCLAILPDNQLTWVWIPLHTSQIHHELELYRGKKCIYCEKFALINDPCLTVPDSLWIQCPYRGIICETLYFVTAKFDGEEVFLGYTPSEDGANEMITNLINISMAKFENC